MGASASCSSSQPISSKKYDVFISFRGEDTRTNFTSHLHTALTQKSLRTYIDYELPKGDDISQSLIQAIQDSSVSVVVFSENYACSKWCLDELTHILKCRKDKGQFVIPVFYKVDPSDVRKQKGTYKDAFAKHERDFMHNPDKVNNWKKALFETANLAGWHSQTFRDESELIQNIIKDVLQKLDHTHPSTLKGLVGIDENCECIELLLEKVPIIGIWGMGGIGKTTMAKVVFAKLSPWYESCCFLENVREESEKHGLKYIRDKLVSELLMEENINGNPPQVLGSTFVMRRLSCRKVFIVLDDVDSLMQLEYLSKEYDCLGLGSKVIVTTRDKHLLIGRVNEIYEAKPLNYQESFKLFNIKAFHKDHPDIGYEQLSKKAIVYAKGNPLALTVLGSFLHSKTKEEWDSALRRLKRTLNEDIQKVLKLSYDGLKYEEKEIFLDIACFLKGEDTELVIALLDSYGFYTSIGLRTLVDKALISINSFNSTVWMHDLVQKMGLEIIHLECIKDPGRRSRLCHPEEVYDVLKNNRGTDAIEGIILDLSQIRDVHLSVDALKKMTNLRFLKLYSPRHRRSCIVNLPLGLESFFDTLRYLQWDNFPLESLPSTFCAEKLVEFHMLDSNLKKLWDGVQDLVNLRRINLDGCEQLIELPDFSKAQNLESVNLSSCRSLCYLHPSILSLQRLHSLRLYGCKNLKNLQSESHLKSLRDLNVNYCFSLKEFSLSSEEIKSLTLDCTGIEILGTSIGRLMKLKSLSLNGSTLKNLPMNEFCRLRSLEKLLLYNCGEIIDKSKLHILFDALQSLRSINLNGSCKLTELPNNIKHLSRLQFLSLRNCKRLHSLPELPPSIEELDATNCRSLEFSLLHEEIMLGVTPHSSIGYLRNLRKLILSNCEQVYELPEYIGSLSSLISLVLQGSNVESLPASIKRLSKLVHIDLTNCRRLRSLPELPPSTKQVTATNCISLETAFSSITSRPRLKYMVDDLYLGNCLKLEKHSLSRIMEYAYFSLKRVAYTNQLGSGDVCYPGRRVPEWFGYNQATKASSFLTIELSATMNNLLGFIFCCILPQFTPKQYIRSNLQCQMYCEDGKQVTGVGSSMSRIEFNSHHVFLWYDPYILKRLEKTKDDQDTNYNPKLSFEFSVVLLVKDFGKSKHDGLIEACGVYPIYASEYHKFLQQMELELEMGTKKQTCHDIDEHSLCGIMEYASFSLKQAKCGNFERSSIYYPETTIPEWFTYKSSTTEASMFVQLAPNVDYLLGFIFCFVIPQFSKERDRSHSGCRWRCEDDILDNEGPGGWHYSMTELNSNDVFLWYDPLYCELILEQLRRQRGNDEESSNYNPKLSFEFEFGDCLIKECGVRPIYASEYRKFIQQKELKLELGTGKKRHREIDDEQEQLPSTKKGKESSIVQPIPLSTKSKTSLDIDELLFTLSRLNLESTKDSSQQ